jgi:hypothetical protein
LSFFLENFRSIPGGDGDFSASWHGKSVFSASVTAFGFTKFSSVVPGTGSDTLQFAGRGTVLGNGYVLDDIVVTPTVVPEPSTLSRFGLGLLLGGALLARKKKLLNGAQGRA